MSGKQDRETEDGLIFYLSDAEGKEHKYECTAHTGRDGLKVTQRITAIAAPIVGRLADAAFSGETTQAIADIAANPSAIQGIDFSGIGESVAEAVVSESLDLPGLVDDILSNTRRDGNALDNGPNFDTAYRRNYGELFAAVAKVVSYNRFLPLSAISAFGARK